MTKKVRLNSYIEDKDNTNMLELIKEAGKYECLYIGTVDMKF